MKPATDYYDREPTVDGRYQNAADTANEQEVARRIEAAWGCEVRSFGSLAPVDFYAVRGDRVAAVMELKCFSHPFGELPRVFLNLRKWLALELASAGLDVPSYFVWRFGDGSIRYVSTIDVVGCSVRIRGVSRPRATSSPTDREPVFEVPIQNLRTLEEDR